MTALIRARARLTISGCSHYKLYKKGDGWTAAMFERGREAYLRYGAGPLKDKILLTGHNLMERALMYAQLTSSATSAPSIGHLVNILWAMLQSGLYAPATNWVQPRGGEGLDYIRASAMWAIYSDPNSAAISDTMRVFFGADIPGVEPIPDLVATLRDGALAADALPAIEAADELAPDEGVVE